MSETPPLMPAIPGDFDRDTAVTGEGGVYRARLSAAWEIWGPAGGYIATVALRAAAREAKIQRPASFYVQFLRTARFDAVDMQVTVVHAGRRAESIRVSMSQDGKPVLEGMLRTASVGEGPEHHAVTAPAIAAPETLPTMDELRQPHSPLLPFWSNIEGRVLLHERFQPGFLPMPPHWVEWYRFRPQATFEDPVLDAARSLMLVDVLGWPAAWIAHPETQWRAPNIDMITFFHASAAHSEWLLCEQTCQIGQGGLLGPSARIFDRAGRLVASGGGQLLSIPGPPA